ncbi:hypothetical protein Baya_2074 [Bagarius yarrelli]|uniref:Uncharacterized protein n=1 Tax=Bagarius yarrelli TaxID=175774 RepID=A0A556TMX2_BAGYA|nr:hypothetical protein Baya_2074 [Bagarius yarrelli]
MQIDPKVIECIKSGLKSTAESDAHSYWSARVEKGRGQAVHWEYLFTRCEVTASDWPAALCPLPHHLLKTSSGARQRKEAQLGREQAEWSPPRDRSARIPRALKQGSPNRPEERARKKWM